MHLARVSLALFMITFLGACQIAGELSPLFRPSDDLWRMRSVVRLAPAASKVEVHTSADVTAETKEYLRRGYFQVGSTRFFATQPIPENWLTGQARAASADVVLASNEYMGEDRTMGSVPFSGIPIPIVRPRYRCSAVFLRKAERLVFGVHVTELTSDDRYNLQRTTGAKVVAVIERSSAARAGIQPGDVLITAGDVRLDSVETLYEAEAALAGQDVPLQLIRDDQLVKTTARFEQL